MMFEVCYNQVKPVYCNTFVRGGESRESMALMGYLSCYVGVLLRKKLVIYTSNDKKDALVAFLEYYNIPNVSVVSSPETNQVEWSSSKADMRSSSKKGPFL